MRIMMLLAAACATAIATAAPAGPAGQPGGTLGGWAAGGGNRAVAGWQGGSRPATGRGHHRRDGRHDGRFGRPDRDGPYFSGGFGIAGPGGIVAPYGNGFFAGRGGEVRMKDGRPHYDYDRSYPYEWAPAAGGRGQRWEVGFVSEPPPRCTVEHGVRVCRGW